MNWKYISTFRNYSVDIYKQALERTSLPNNDNFQNRGISYNNFINRLDCVVNTVVSFRIVSVKNNTRYWFDGEIAYKIYTHDKLYKRFKLTKLHVDEEIYEEAQNVVQNLIRTKKSYFEKKTKRKHKKSEKNFRKH